MFGLVFSWSESWWPVESILSIVPITCCFAPALLPEEPIEPVAPVLDWSDEPEPIEPDDPVPEDPEPMLDPEDPLEPLDPVDDCPAAGSATSRLATPSPAIIPLPIFIA